MNATSDKKVKKSGPSWSWSLDLQLPMQSVPITTKVVNSNLFHGEVYSIQHYVIKFVSDDNKWWIFIKYYYTHFVPVLLKMLLEWQLEPFNRNGSGRFGAVKSDSTLHFFGNACTKSGPLRFSQFSGCWLILSVYWLMSFAFAFGRLLGVQ